MQPSSLESRGQLHIISGSDYLHRQESRRHRGAISLAVPFAGLWVDSVFTSLGVLAVEVARLADLTEVRLPTWAGMVALGMILLDCSLLSPLERLIQERDQFRQGRQGEDATAEALRQHLDDRWTLFRNIVLPAHQADIDAILVGPPGVYVLEIKSYRGHFKTRGDQWWWRRYQPGWHQMTRSPSKQAKANAASLGELLHETVGEKVWVEPCVVWVGPGKLYIGGRPGAYIWFFERMGTYADNLRSTPARPGNAMQKVHDALQRMALADRNA